MRSSDVDPAPATAARHRRAAAARRQAGRRPGMLLGALLAGGLAAAVLGLNGPASAADSSVTAAQRSINGGLGDDSSEEMPQAAISEAEAKVRLQQVAASRAARQAAAVAAATPPAPECVLPVTGARLTSTFAERWGVMHWGIDLAAPMRTPEHAARDGVVLRAGPSSGFGLAVYILHENGDVTVYGHMDSILVKAGQVVQAGQTIALLGMRGESTGPHLHFEVHHASEYGGKIDPIPWLRACGVTV
jgi:murein DD-endopeptidase MepM/ murein hydrolase activator NlpD